MHCTITAPGDATNLTGVKLGLAAGSDGRRLPVAASRVDFVGELVVITLSDAARLDALLDAARSAGTEPSALFSAHEHQLFVEFDLTEGAFTPCDELEGSAEADLSFTFEELVDGPLADLREVRAASTDVHG